MSKHQENPLPKQSGYREAQPLPAKKGQSAPDAKTPHEPHNVPEKKPNSDSG